MPRFHIRDTFTLQDKSTFVLAGFVVEGQVEPGMEVNVPFNSSVIMTAQIDRIESVHWPDGDMACLCLKCTQADEATLWEALNLRNQTVTITRPA